jgi:Tol biopolymer transport system component/DNA-binding winged helix-turn-helix (wHTH) protein
LTPLIDTGDFEVGPWRVKPSRAEIEADGETLRLEPRVMGVLVALARRPGETVGRERLIADVWEGRIVTDDAVQRCIAALRKILRSRPGVDIETLPKLGYALRLATAPADATRGPVPAPADKAIPAWAAVAIIAVLGLGAFWWMSADIPASSKSRTVGPRSTPLTSLRGREVQAALAPAGGQVAFSWSGEDGRNPDIYVKTISGGGLLRLTTDAALDRHPAWSPDGGEIAFMRHGPRGCVLLRAPAVGGEARRIADCGAPHVRSIDWSPDGATLAVTAATDDLANGRLQLIDIASGETRALDAIDALGANIEDARFSADGESLAFSVGRALGVEDVHVYDFENRTLRRITYDGLKVHSFDWAPDGNSIIYSSNRAGPFQLWRAPLAGGAPTLVPGSGDAADDPTVAPNGRIVYESWREDAEIMRFDLANPEAAPVRAAGSTRFEWDAQVSPDGGRMAFISDQSGAAEVWIAWRDGSGARQLTEFGGPYTHSPRWSADGRQLAFVAPVSGRMDLFVLALEDGRARRIGDSGFDYFAPTWSRDGSKVLTGAKNGKGASEIQWVPVNGGASTRFGATNAQTPQLSADGAMLYFTKPALPGIWRRPLQGDAGQEERIVDDLTPVDWNNWRVTPKALYYVQRAPSSEPVLTRFDLDARTARVVRSLPGLLYKSGLWISADERELLATVIVSSEADLQLIQ